MNIVCAICQDALEQSSDIFTTPCGHTFHFPCLIQWLENAKNCPQCRQKVGRDKIIRLYFNFANTESVKEDSFTLQSKIDSLSFQIKLRETELSTAREDNNKLKRQNQGLRDEVKKDEKKINELNSVIHTYRDQVSHQKEKYADYDKIKQENEMLKIQIEKFCNIQVLLNGTPEDVDKMLKKNEDPHSLATYISIMKRELAICMEKRRLLRTDLRRLQSELQDVKIQRESENDYNLGLIKSLEEKLMIAETQKDSLHKYYSEKLKPEVADESDQAGKESEVSANAISRKRENNANIDTESVPSKKVKKTTDTNDDFDLTFSFENSNNSDVTIVSPEKNKSKGNEENSPYLPTKSKSILSFKDKISNRGGGLSIRPKQTISSNKYSFSSKNSKEDNNIQFDGFGGHSKIDVFPMPKSSSPNKLKRSMTDSSKNKKLKLDFGSSKQNVGSKLMDDYVVNLT